MHANPMSPMSLLRMIRFTMLIVLLVGGLAACSNDNDDVEPGDVGVDVGVDVGSCEPGARKEAGDGCNSCTCSGDGQWQCTLIGCEEDAGLGDVDADGDACQEGDSKKVDCNTCVCDADGNWGCTKIACNTHASCEGKSCGDACSTCDPSPGSPCPGVMEFCNEAGECSSKAPACGI